jgi:Kef-type K+ transport system membrane component KefB
LFKLKGMGEISTEMLLIVLCSLIALSYLFSIASRVIKVPSVLLLLFAGIFFRFLSKSNHYFIPIPSQLVESLGVVGLIMIVLEAGLDLKLERSKMRLIRNAFFSALVILVFSTALVTTILFYWLHEPILKCLIYAVPLSIMSSSITIPSLHHLTRQKKEFLIYEASFSDILGILFFNYLVAGELLAWQSVVVFSLSLVVSIVFSVVLSIGLFFILAKTRLNIRFFLIFSLLILIYTGGKLLHLPSLLIILVFGLMINNWEKIKSPILNRYFPQRQVTSIATFLHSITAESSFLVRTFFFILFGYSIDLAFLQTGEIWIIGSLIVLALFVVRFLYLRFFLHTNVFPETFFIPRGLVSIVLFYKIPDVQKLASFNNDILFFIILSTSVILALGMIFTKSSTEDVIEEPEFSERKDIL